MKILGLFFLLLINSGNDIKVENAWARSSSQGLTTALFFDVKNNGDKADTLFKVTSDAAEIVQVHETYKKGDMMGMREVENVVIEPDSTFHFKPRGHHIMLIKLRKDLNVGDKIEVTLHFKQAGEIKTSAVIKEI